MLSIILLLISLSFSFANNSPEFIVDDHGKFEVHWSIALIKEFQGKKETLYLKREDLLSSNTWTSKLSDEKHKRACRFQRSEKLNILTPDEWFQVLGKLYCEFGEMKMKLEPITCYLKKSENKETSDSSSVRIQFLNEDLYFIYSCNTVIKK